MSGPAIVKALLSTDPRVLAFVPADRIIVGPVPQNAILPAISVRRISGSEQGTTARNLPVKMQHERVQVTVLAKDYKKLDQLRKAASLGGSVHAGVVVGFVVKNVLPWGEGPDIDPDSDGIYETSRDFMVTFVEAN